MGVVSTLNNVRVVTITTGQGTVALGSAYATNFLTEVEAGAVDGATYRYRIDQGNDFEIGTGVYTSSGRTLTRATVHVSKIGGTAGTTKLTLTGSATVRVVVSAEDFNTSLRADVTTHGDSDYTIVATDKVVATSASLSAPRTFTLPAANALPAGQELVIADVAGGITTTNTLSVSRAGSDTIDGGTTVKINRTYGYVVLRSDGSSKWKIVSISSGPIVTVYTSGSGTHTTTAGIKHIRRRLVGGGGGGSGGGTSNPAGGNGGNTTFGALTANAGSGAATRNGGAGGAASGGNNNITGNTGETGCTSTVGDNLAGGSGAGNAWSAGAPCATAGAAGTSALANTGAGGSGGPGSSGVASTCGGGGGAGGYCEDCIANPAATYSYAVGAGGSAGSAGTGSGFAGGAGGSGLIIIEESYE